MQSEVQRDAALAKAKEIRTSRRELKERLYRGETTLREVFESDDADVQTMRIAELVGSLQRVGAKKAEAALEACDLRPSTRLRTIPMSRRRKLLAWLDKHYPGVYGVLRRRRP